MRKIKDYKNTIIYKLVCNDTSIKDIYIGHTTNFLERLRTHRNRSKKYDYKLYQCIKDNGSFENWSMIEIKKFPCKDKREAEHEERKIIELYSPSLNTTKRPIITEEERIIKKKECDKLFRPIYYEKNKELILQKHKEHRNSDAGLYRKVVTNCECGGRYIYHNKNSHFKANIHLTYLKELNEFNN
jgi:hypothetical protein